MLVTFDGVSKIFGSGDGLHSSSFSLKEGEVVGLFGLNGSGKTTTMKLLSGLLAADQGSILVKGMSPRKARDEISYLGDKLSFYHWMTPDHVAKFLSGIYKNFEPGKFEQLKEVLEVPDKPIGQMSKGQAQRLRIVATMSRKASIYVLDEPLSGIDLVSRKIIIEALIQQWDQSSTILLSTHEIKEVETFFDRGIFLKNGKIVSDIDSKFLGDNGINGFTDHFIELHKGKESQT